MSDQGKPPFPLDRLVARPDVVAEVEGPCAQAREYLESHEWCAAIHGEFFAGGDPKVFTVHLFEVDVAEVGQEWLWVCRGQTPPAYLDDSVDSPQDALDAYGELMEDWVNAVRGWGEIDDCYPVELDPTEDSAAELDERLHDLAHDVRDGLEAAPEAS